MKRLLAHPLRNRYLLLSDFCLLVVAAYVSYVLRLEKFDLGVHWPGFLLVTGLRWSSCRWSASQFGGCGTEFCKSMSL